MAATGIAILTFVLLVVGILSLSAGSKDDADVYLRRTRGERIAEPITPHQAGYVLEGRRDGEVVPVRLSDFRQRLVFLNFWGTFCPPCIEELPSLLALARSRSPEDLVIVAVSYDESWEAIDTFFSRFTSAAIPPNFIVLRDPERIEGRDLRASMGTRKIPESWLLRNDTVEARFVSSRDWISPDIVALVDVLVGR
jgi:thiol-disulfide isomerase/thioredoxin